MFRFLFDSDTWQEIYGGIRKNKTRTVITIIGVLWGIFLLVVLLGAARGMENNFKSAFGDFATNSLVVWTERTDTPFKGFQKGRKIQLKKRDKKSLIYGRFLNKNDVKKKTKVIVIEENIYKQLFEKDEYPINQNIILNNVNYKVVGVYKSGTIDFDGSAAYIPFTTFQQVYNRGNKIDWMLITAKEGVDIEQFEKDIQLTLKNLHKVHPKDKKAIGGINLASRIGRVTGFLTGMQFLTWFVGIATLIAGVFAIGNILLITVKERTKEIGIRRAIGATPLEIRQQVVLEAIFLTTIAGMLGIIFGGFVLFCIDNLFGSGPDPVLLNPTVSISIILIAFIILMILGTLIGLIPAFMATMIKPIEALRDE